MLVAAGSLVVLVGPGASGKTGWSAAHFAADEIVSADRLRAVVGTGEHDLAASADAFDLLERIVDARVRRALTTVVDTLGLDAPLRARLRELAARHGRRCVAVRFDTPAAECRRRNAARTRRLPAAVLTAQLRAYAALAPTLADEGFDEVLVAEPVRVVDPQVAEAARRLGRPAGPPTAPIAATEPGRGLRFGLHLSAFECPGGPAELGARLRDVAQRAEAAGFSSLWVMDHHRQIPQVGRAWEAMPEAGTTLAVLAAATRTVSVGALVHCVTFRDLPLLGRMVATLDVLSGGRVWCGLGAGWFEAEQVAYGRPFPPTAERLDLLEDALQFLPLLWGPGSPRFEGRRITVPEAMCYPRPLAGRVPILVGGGGVRRTLGLVARYADACNLTGDLATLTRKLDVLRAHCADVGRDPTTVRVTHLSSVRLARDTAQLATARREGSRRERGGRVPVTTGTAEDLAVHARALHDAGVDDVIVALADVWEPGTVESYGEVIASTVRSSSPLSSSPLSSSPLSSSPLSSSPLSSSPCS